MKTSRLSINEIIKHIELGKYFEAIPLDGGFKIKVSKYVPYCCTAIHDGSKVRTELKKKIALNEFERWYEEDPFTGSFIASLPITIIGLDSRFEYDLNRDPENCIYTEAWGKKVWKRSLSASETKLCNQKHANYYQVLNALISKLEELFGGCVVYDMHSYNHERWDKDVPLFNIGTENIDLKKHRHVVDHWLGELKTITLPDVVNNTKENDVFLGRGYNLKYLSETFQNTLVLATEVKKIYCNELTGDAYPKLISKLQNELKQAILNNANYFGKKLDKWHHISTPKLLDKSLDRDILRIDKALFSELGNFELISAVNPINISAEKRKFFKSKCTELPTFKYNPISINPFELKQNLLSIPLLNIQDVSVRSLYQAVIDGYFDKIDLIGSLNTNKFLYNSLRYFGRPSKKDLLNASYILLLPDIPGEAKKEPIFNAKQAIGFFQQALDEYKLKAKIELSNKLVSKVMVLNSKQSILFRPDATFRLSDLKALIEHEIGVHMLTTVNSSQEQLKIFNLGLPVNTETQEGLAILVEYLSGNISLRRLKSIALRVIIVDMMCSGGDFIDCFDKLIKDYGIEENDAFTIVTRIFRGGGFTKDYLYLSGFVKVFKLWEEHHDLTPLLVGKTSLPYFNTIEEMIGREMISKPAYITKSILSPKIENNSSIYKYIFSGLKY